MSSLVAAIALRAVAAPAAVAAPPSLRLGAQVAAPLRGRRALVVRQAPAPARSGPPERAADRDRVSLAAAAPPAAPPPGPGGGRGRARVSVDRQPRRVHRHLRAAAARARAAARGQPRHRRLGADQVQRLQDYPGASSGLCGSRAVVARCAREIARRYGSPDLFATAYATRDLAALMRALQARAGRPLRRLVRDLLRAVLHRAPPGPAALGGARLLVSRARSRPVVRLVGDCRAQRAWTRSARAIRAARPAAPTARLGALLERLRRRRDLGTVRRADGGRGGCASACTRSSTWFRTPAPSR